MESSIPKYVFDKEYSTQWRREVEFLRAKGIEYVFAKKHYKYHVTKYKYTKTPELFLALAEFYKQVYIENIHEKLDKANKELLPVEEYYVEADSADSSDEEVLFTEQEINKLLEDIE